MGFSLSDLDPTYSKGWAGKKLGSGGVNFFRQAVATGAVWVTGGTVLLVRPDLKDDALRGYRTGATFGASWATSGNLLGSGAAAAGSATDGGGTTSPSGTGAFAPAGPGPLGGLDPRVLWVGLGVLLLAVIFGGRR